MINASERVVALVTVTATPDVDKFLKKWKKFYEKKEKYKCNNLLM